MATHCLSVGATSSDVDLQQLEVSGYAATSPERFSQYKDSWMVWQQMRNGDGFPADEYALRAHYAFKYSICGTQITRSLPAQRKSQPAATVSSLCSFVPLPSKAELFLAYTGEFDFYMGTRRSGPVINRLSQPGLYVRLPLDSIWKEARVTDSFELGLVHASNGQTTDVSTPEGTLATGRAHERRDHRFFDTISRTANFFSVAAEVSRPNGWPIDAQIRLRAYLGTQESSVVWDPRLSSKQRFSDFDRLEFQVRYWVTPKTQAEVQWRVGDSGLAKDSLTLGLVSRFFELPLYLRVHRGPMNTLSNHAQIQNSVGLGMWFTRF